MILFKIIKVSINTSLPKYTDNFFLQKSIKMAHSFDNMAHYFLKWPIEFIFEGPWAHREKILPDHWTSRFLNSLRFSHGWSVVSL